MNVKSFVLPLLACLTLFLAGACFADQWGSVVMAECNDNLIGRSYQEHMFVRVFHTELGGGQLDALDGQAEGIFSLEQLHRTPFSCVVNGKAVRFELVGYRPPRENGACTQCQQTGFRLTAGGEVTWEIPTPSRLGMPIFNGTIDLDRETARICTAQRIEQPEENFAVSNTSMMTCRTVSH